MAVKRMLNFPAQGRFDLVDLRLLESSIVSDFDDLSGRALSGYQPLVLKGFTIDNLIYVGQPAENIQLNTAGGVLFNINASESGTLLAVASDRAIETLNASNPRLNGSFTSNTVNYLGIDYARSLDPSTADTVKILDPQTGLEFPKKVPLGRVLDYVLVLTTQDFSVTPGIIPIAKITTDLQNNVTFVQDARNMFFRLGSGGSAPNNKNAYIWGTTRSEPVVGSISFNAADKNIDSLKAWVDAAMTRMWEIGGGEHWYSPTADRNVRMTRTGAAFTNGEWFQWTGTNLHWQGIRFYFDNSLGYRNDVKDQLTDLPGLTDLSNDGDCIYVDLDRSSNKTGGNALQAVKANVNTLGTPIVPGSRFIIAQNVSGNVYARDSSFPVGSSFSVVATPTSLGIVELAYAAGTPLIPKVPPLNATNGIALNTIGNGTGVTSTGSGTGHGLSGTSGTGAGAYGVVGYTASATNGTGIYGQGVGTGFGVEGVGNGVSGYGIHGYNLNPNGSGILGEGTGTGEGVVGVSGTGASTYGVAGNCKASSGGAGVYGFGFAGTSNNGVLGIGGTVNGSIGVVGGTAAANGTGVKGVGQGTGAGVEGIANNAVTYGIYGHHTVSGGTGVAGQGNDLGPGVIGLAGNINNGVGVYGIGPDSFNGIGVKGLGSGTGTGVLGLNDPTATAVYAIYGQAVGTDNNGVLGSGTGFGTGIEGHSGSTDGSHGITGLSFATNGDGVYGHGTGTGVGIKGDGESGGVGVYGNILSGNGIGVKGTGVGTSDGGYFKAGVTGAGGLGLRGIGGSDTRPGIVAIGNLPGDTGAAQSNVVPAVALVTNGTALVALNGNYNGTTGSVATTNKRAIQAFGTVSLEGGNPSPTEAGARNTLSPSNIAKAWGTIRIAGSTPFLVDGLGLTSTGTPVVVSDASTIAGNQGAGTVKKITVTLDHSPANGFFGDTTLSVGMTISHNTANASFYMYTPTYVQTSSTTFDIYLWESYWMVYPGPGVLAANRWWFGEDTTPFYINFNVMANHLPGSGV